MRAAGTIGLPGGRAANKPGPFRFVPPKQYHPSKPLPTGPAGGFRDRYDNEWVLGPAHGKAFNDGDHNEWDVQLSAKGLTVWGNDAKVVNGKAYINVTKDGRLSH